jgi:capsular polysaccharide biosynthesis protein
MLTLFRHEKWLIIAITLTVAVASLVAALVLPKKYQAEVLVAPVDTSQSAGGLGGGDVGSLLSKVGGLASIVGDDSSLSGSKEVDIATLQSELLTRQYIQKNNLLPVLFASKWDARHDRWRTHDPAKVPTLWGANRYFASHVRSVTKVGTTGLYRVAITWTNAKVAAEWANGIVALTNDYLRDQAIREDDANVAYLEQQAEKTSMVGVKTAIFNLIEQELRDAMIAQGRHDYALKVIDPAFVPDKPYSPQPVQWTGIGFVLGLLGSAGFVLFKARRGTSVPPQPL